MTRSGILIFTIIGALSAAMLWRSSAVQSVEMRSFVMCVGFSSDIASDTLYNCPGDTHLYASDTSSNYTYEWISPAGSTISNDWEIFVNTKGIYGLVVIDTFLNCMTTDSIFVRALPCEDLSSEFIPPGIDETIYLDTVAPTFTAPNDTTIYTSGLCVASSASSATGEVLDAMDDCDPILDIIFQDSSSVQCAGSLTIYRRWTVTDECGNSANGEQVIIVTDNSAPTIVVPADITLYTDNLCTLPDTSAAALGDFISIDDNCDNSVTTASHSDVVTSICEGAIRIERTWSATDDCNNTGTATQVITVTDNQGPIIYIPTDTIITDGGAPRDPTVTDNCTTIPNLTFVDQMTSSGCLTTINRTWTATDDCGNTTDSIQVIIRENTFDTSVNTSDYNGFEISCPEAADGTILLIPFGGISPYTFSWSNGYTINNASNLDTGTYIIRVIDNRGCEDTLTVILAQPDSLEAVFVNTNPICAGEASGSIDLQISGGATPYTYIWSHDGSVLEDPTNLADGTYSVTITDANGCSTIDSTVLNDPVIVTLDVNITSDFNGNAVSCIGAADGSITVTANNANGSIDYSWSNGSTSNPITGLVAGTYYVTATDIIGCSAIDSITILDHPGITPTITITSDYNGSPVSCYDAADANLTIAVADGAAPYTYLWSNGQSGNTLNGLDTGMYTVQVTDANGCLALDTVVIEYSGSTIFDINIDTNYNGNALSCSGASDANISVQIIAGAAPYIYSWSNGSSSSSQAGLAAGVYNLTVTDANGCETVDFISIPNPPPLTVSFNTTLVDCGATNGQIYVNGANGSGTYEFSIDSTNWQSQQVFSNLAPGMYNLYMRDAITGCASVGQSINLITASAPDIDNLTIINPTMVGSTDGAILVTASGIGLEIEYQLQGSSWQSSNLFDQLGEGTYNIDVRYEGQTCTNTIVADLGAGGGITTIDSTSNVCSPEISNISTLGVYYIPIGEDEILEALQTITPAGCADRYSVDPIQNYIYVGVVESGTIITYDQWEDGFEPNFDFSIQPSTEIWGDGNPDNGLPPGYSIDYLEAGDNIFLDNAVVSTTRATVIDYDAGDRISSRGDISITRLGWATGSSTLFAGAVEVQERNNWGLNYSIPVGQNTDVNDMFVYTGFSVMAGTDNTTIELDIDGNGILDNIITLNQGESYLVNGGVNSGGTINADHPVQVHLITGDDCSNYESRWFTLSPEENWDDGYFIPVSTLNNGGNTTSSNNKPTYVHLYNPNANPINVIYRTVDGIQDTLIVTGGGTAYQEIPQGTGAHFEGTENFYAIATIDSDSGNNMANDWGFALLPERQLSPQIYLTGFAPGQNPAFTCDIGITIPTANYTITTSSEETNAINGETANAFDNDLTTAWYSEYSTVANGHPHEMIIDLGSTENVIGFRHTNALSTVYIDNYQSPNPPVIIPNNTLFNTSTSFAITDNHSIIDLNVNLDFTHSRISDLRIILESPSGSQVTLFDRGCTNEMDIVVTFDDDSENPFDCATSGNGESFLSIDALSAFDMEYSAGVWTLIIEDQNGIVGGGSLNSWSLDITHGTSAPGAIEDFEFYVSQDGVNWGIPLLTGTWDPAIPLHDERMCAIDARYVRFVSLSDFGNMGMASIGEFEVLSCGSSYAENSSPLWITAGHASGWTDTMDIQVCVDFNGDGGSITDPTGATYDSSYAVKPLGLLKIYDPDGDQTGIRIWVCDGSDGLISGAWGQDPANASPADPAIDLGVGLINSIPYSAQKCVQLFNDISGNGVFDQCDEVTYTIVIQNTGALPLSTGSISIIDTLPAELEYIPGSSRGIVDGIQIDVADDSINTTVFPFDEGGSAIDTIILPGDSLLIQFEALIAYIDFGTFITNTVYAQSGNNSFEPFVSIPVQEPINPLDTLVPVDTLISCEAFMYPDASLDSLSYLALHDTIFEGSCLDAFTFQRIFTYTDNCGRQYIDTMQITVRDTTPPVILIPEDTVIHIVDSPFFITVPTTDNCDVDVDLTYSDDTTFNNCSYLIERVYIAEDNCSNTSQETMNITVILDQTSWPVIINADEIQPCSNDTVHLMSSIQNSDGLPYYAQWYFRTNAAVPWIMISGADAPDYSFVGNTTTSGQYQVQYRGELNPVDSNCIIHIQDIDIDVLPIPTSAVQLMTICPGDTIDFFGQAIYQTGQYQHLLSNANGCDSIVRLDLDFHTADQILVRDTTCYQSPIIFGGIVRTGGGTYFDTLANMTGCDSIIQLELFEHPAVTHDLNLETCPSDPVIFNGKTIDSTGVYQEVFMSQTGCDSIVTLNLIVRDIPESLVTIPLCFGDSTLINSQYVYSSGIYTESLFDQYGCDSIARYDVQIANELIVFETDIAICEGDSLPFNGLILNQPGQYEMISSSHLGCDSMTIITLSVEARTRLIAEDFIICEGETVQLNVQGADQVEWADPYGLDCATCPNPTVQPSQTTVYSASAPSCLNTTNTVDMSVTVLPTANIYAMADTSIVAGSSVLLRATVDNPDAQVTWMEENGTILCTDCYSVRVSPEESTTYIVEADIGSTCQGQANVHVDVRNGCVEGELIVPNFITPNADGENDVFTVQWAGIKSADKISIFNRWGELIFTTDQVDKNFWDGMVNGEPVNPGVYMYYVEYYCLNNNLQRRKGNVTVIR